MSLWELAQTLALPLGESKGDTQGKWALSDLGAYSALGSSEEEVHAFAKALQEIMIEHRNLGHDWGFDVDQAETLGAYYAANQLLVDCLDVAYVSNRAAIEERLLRPPGAWRAEDWVG